MSTRWGSTPYWSRCAPSGPGSRLRAVATHRPGRAAAGSDRYLPRCGPSVLRRPGPAAARDRRPSRWSRRLVAGTPARRGDVDGAV